MPPSNQFSSGLSLHPHDVRCVFFPDSDNITHKQRTTTCLHQRCNRRPGSPPFPSHTSSPNPIPPPRSTTINDLGEQQEGETIRITVKNKPASGAGMLSSAGLSEKIKPLNLAPPPEKVKSKPLGLAPPPVASGKIRSPIPPAPNDPAAVRMTSTTHHIVARNSTNAFTYFSQLEGSDQDKLKQIVSEEDPTSTKDQKSGKTDKDEERVKEKKNATNEKIVAEYAKSGRSSCKKCSEKIDSKSLRLGSSIWDPRGYENTKSYHSDCFFPLDVNLLSAELIEGFSQLKSNDQEKLKKLMTERDQSSKKTSDKIDEDIGLKIDFSANDVKDNYKLPNNGFKTTRTT
ncbi:unnamed protein product [Lactuca saligna]|uniref:PARP-type domain-containing protein n=1 Tax=Lactuca saligna TaxID=75948 RepID=A0AA35Y4N6_LACSI|nr:unnamed protein product [Lactuca saligna]